MYIEQRGKPKHDKTVMKQLLLVVKFLNNKFKKNHYFKKQKIQPFKLYWTFSAEWFIVCDNHYIWSDDPKFKTFKRILFKKFPKQPIQFCFYMDKRVFLNEKVFAIK